MNTLRIVNGRVMTPRTFSGGGIVIGGAYTPVPPSPSRDSELIQEALLDRRTARPSPVLQRIAGAIWRWC